MTMGRTVKRGGGRQVMLLLFLLAVLGGYGTWNYKRNVAAESTAPRPYKGYSDEQLAQLESAYQAQVEALGSRYEAVAKQRSGSRDTALLGEAVDEFARVQRSSRAVRELGARVSQEEASLEAIRQEKSMRARMGKGLMAFLKKAFLPPA